MVSLALELVLCKAQLGLTGIWHHSFKTSRVLGLKIGVFLRGFRRIWFEQRAEAESYQVERLG